ncbi:MAG: NHL repeat-containing protein [Deltaproteobacteria bacterium]|nr:NHL repeat-containing protein [Deltaproteobacteria bacterium]
MLKKSLFVILIILIVPFNAFGKKDKINIITTLTSNEEIGFLGLIDGLFFDENKKRLYVSDSSNSRILSYDSEFKYISSLQPGGDLKNPASLVRTSDGRFLAVEPSRRGVLTINIRDKSIKQVDFSKVPEAEAFYPGNIAIDSGDNIYIIDRANSRVLLFNSNLQFEREVLRDNKTRISDIKVDKQGNIYTLSTIEGIVKKYDGSGKKILEFGSRGKGKDEFNFPVSLAVDEKGLIYVVDQHKSKVLVFDKSGRFLFDFSELGWREGRLAYPSFIFINNSGIIFIVDRDNSRISVFR